MSSRYEAVLEGAAHWGAFYRKHPDQFANDYLHVRLKLFQKLLLTMMFWSTTFVFVACRGIGKTYLSAMYCVIRAILYPGSKICVASSVRGQSINVLEKILYELKPNSPELANEIDEKETQINNTKAQIVFKNGSYIKVVTASDSARGKERKVEQVMIKEWSDDDVEFLKANYADMETSELAKVLGRTRSSVVLKANRAGVTKRKHHQDNSYFEQIDSSDKAYWLGFIAADGYVLDSDEGRYHELGIELSEKDKEHLLKFAEAIGSDQKPRFRQRKTFKKRGYDKEYSNCFIRLYSKSIVDSLKRYGVVQNKTKWIQFPDIQEEFLWDYIRGYFDGDGSVVNTSVTTPYGKTHFYTKVSIVIYNEEFVKSFSSFLFQNGVHSVVQKEKNWSVLWINEKASALRFYECLYSDAECTKLDRKYKKYTKLVQQNNLPA